MGGPPAHSDVVVDSLVVAKARSGGGGEGGLLQSLCWGGSAVGSILSAAASGPLLEHLGPRPIFVATAAFPLLVHTQTRGKKKEGGHVGVS